MNSAIKGHPIDVVIGTPINNAKAYIIDKFLYNQQKIQSSYPSSELILATVEYNFASELKSLVNLWKLRGLVVHYEVIKPNHAHSKIWNIACGREAIRKYMLSQTEAKYLLFLDADMVFDPSIVSIMQKEIQGYDVVFSGYPLQHYGIGLAGAGCLILTRNVLEKINFRCYEFENGEVIFEDNVLEMDLFRLGNRVKTGFFTTISHFNSANEVKHITPQPVGTFRKLSNCQLVRYVLIRASIICQHNIPWRLKIMLNRFLRL